MARELYDKGEALARTISDQQVTVRIVPQREKHIELHPERLTATLPKHSMAALCEIARGDKPCQSFNPGVNDLLVRRGLAELVLKPSPFATGKGKQIQHLRILEQGRRLLGEVNEEK